MIKVPHIITIIFHFTDQDFSFSVTFFRFVVQFLVSVLTLRSHMSRCYVPIGQQLFK